MSEENKAKKVVSDNMVSIEAATGLLLQTFKEAGGDEFIMVRKDVDEKTGDRYIFNIRKIASCGCGETHAPAMTPVDFAEGAFDSYKHMMVEMAKSKEIDLTLEQLIGSGTKLFLIGAVAVFSDMQWQNKRIDDFVSRFNALLEEDMKKVEGMVLEKNKK